MALDKFEAGSLTKSLNVHTPDFQTDIQLSSTTVNLTSGLQEGIGPRYGMTPLPGHHDREAPAAGKAPGFAAAEPGDLITYRKAIGSYVSSRTKNFGIFPIKMRGDGSVLDVTKTYTFYAVLVGLQDNNGYLVDALLLSTYNGPQNGNSIVSSVPSSDLRDGLPYTGPSIANNGSPAALNISLVPGSSYTNLANLLSIDSSTVYVSATPFSASGIEVPMKWLGTIATSNGDASHVGKMAAMSVGFSGVSLGYKAGGGIPPAFNYGNFSQSLRGINVFCLDSYGDSNADFTGTITPTTTNYLPLRIDDPTLQRTTIDLSATSLTKLSGTAGGSSGNPILYNDPGLTCNSSYQGIMVATGKSAIMFVIQDWYKGQVGDQTQYVDLCNLPLAPPTFNYTQDGATTPSCFSSWPNFVRGTAMTGGNGVALGAANSGILRSNTSYEFTYAIYDKRLNYETNVGQPVKFYVGAAADFVGLQLWTSTFVAGAKTIAANLAKNAASLVPWPGTTSSFVGASANSNVYLNYLEYRFYYRQEGMQEWLPALFMDAAQLWFYPHHTPMMACTGGIGGLVGGRPGGFADYSPLPKDTWRCVVMYKNRAFWFSDKACSFSRQNNLLAYPAANSAACPVGAFRGAIVHAYPGEADQDARLVVFSTGGTYVGKFTGNQQQIPVQVSPTSIGNFGLDGSDFVLNTWTNVTAFSQRAAVVAEGVLYFWGPQGVFKDDGVSSFADGRISLPLEPDIFGWYDPSQTDAIHCVYNDSTKEITWFYPPSGANNNGWMKALTYSTVKKSWLPQLFQGWVDAAQTLKVETASLPVAGTRTIVHNRNSSAGGLQRTAFFDQRNLCGDFFCGNDFMVKQISTPAAGQRRLTLASTNLSFPQVSNFKVGDLIGLHQTSNYANGALALPSDFIGSVVATDWIAGTVDIALPAGATIDAAVTISDHTKYLPMYHAAIAANGFSYNGIAYKLGSKYWIPAGMSYWAIWAYLHMVFKLTNSVPTPAGVLVNIGYRTPVSGSPLTDVLKLTDNSDGNSQIWHPMSVGDQAIEGQGLQLTVSGVQLVGAWVLQYLQAFASPETGDQLKIFEG